MKSSSWAHAAVIDQPHVVSDMQQLTSQSIKKPTGNSYQYYNNSIDMNYQKGRNNLIGQWESSHHYMGDETLKACS